jgi:C4-dicarboxylate-binding protein DctP
MLTEFYTSLEQKVADCCIVPYSILRSSKVYELTPYITETNEIFFTHAWLVNEKFYQTLPADLQETLGKSIKEAQDILWDMAIETEKNDREFLKSQGIKIYQMDEEFKQKLYDSRMPVYEYLFQNYPGIEDLLKKIER